jgi:hypothetical protein
MARRSSYVPLKKRTPKWYCTNQKYGKVQNLVSYPKTLYYITDPREIKVIKKMLGNPSFFEYDYLLITRDEIGDFEEIFGVTAPVLQNGNKDFAAFSGDVDRVIFGWAQDKRHYDAIMAGENIAECQHGEPCDHGDMS